MQNFPNNPTQGELFTQGISRFEWNGSAWNYLGPTSNIEPNTLTTKVTAKANAGTWIQMDGFQWRLPTGGNRSLIVRYVGGSSTFIYGASNGTVTGGYVGGLSEQTLPYNIDRYIVSGWSFNGRGFVQEYTFISDVNSAGYDISSYRVTMQIGPAFNNNLFTIEKFN
jgi:hypothetical protein